MEADNIYDQMAQCDFKTPFKITITFEENEEDDLTEESNPNLDNINTIDTSILENSITDLIDANKITQKPNTESSRNMVVNDSLKEIVITNSVENMTEMIDNTLKRKSSIECNPNSKTKRLENNDQENPINQSNIPNTTESLANKNVDKIFEENNIDRHLNDLDNNTLMQINTEILKQLLKKVSEHLVIIIKEQINFIQIQKDKSITVRTLDDWKQYYLRLKYHYFDLSYCTVSTILLSQEKNAGFIKRFLNHILQQSKVENINCTYNDLETLYREMMSWVKIKKQNLPTLSQNASNHNENTRLKQQLVPPKNQFRCLEDLCKQKQNTCIFKSGPIGRQVQLSIDSSLIPQTVVEASSIQRNGEQLSSEPLSAIYQNKQQSDESSLLHQNGQPKTIGSTMVNQNNPPAAVEPSINYQNRNKKGPNLELSLNKQQTKIKKQTKRLASPIRQKRQHVNPEPSSIEQLKNHQLSASFARSTSLAQRNEQHVIPVSSSIQNSVLGSKSNLEPTSLENRFCNNVYRSLPQNSERRRTEASLIHQDKQRKISKHPNLANQQNEYLVNPAFEQAWMHQNSQAHHRLQTAANFKQGVHNGYTFQLPHQCVNYTNCNFSHYNPLPCANYQTAGNILQQLPAAYQNMLPPQYVVPNYATAPIPEKNRSSETSTVELSLPLIEDLPDANFTPMITHVTSLNPNAYHIIEGNCIVCKKSTKTKCLGCYKRYYCSHECQMKDWKLHMHICRTENNGHQGHQK